MTAKRTVWMKKELDTDAGAFGDPGDLAGAFSEKEFTEIQYSPAHQTTRDSFNLIGSLTETGTHMPVIDLDIPARLIPSSTHGHHHLYIDKELTKEQYDELLFVMHKIGLIETGVYRAFCQSGLTQVRPPWNRGTKNYELSSSSTYEDEVFDFMVTHCDNGRTNLDFPSLRVCYPYGMSITPEANPSEHDYVPLNYILYEMQEEGWSWEDAEAWFRENLVGDDESEDYLEVTPVGLLSEAKLTYGDSMGPIEGMAKTSVHMRRNLDIAV